MNKKILAGFILFFLLIVSLFLYLIFYFFIMDKPVIFNTSLDPNHMKFDNIDVVFVYDDLQWDETTIKNLCYSEDINSMQSVVDWFGEESKRYNKSFSPKLKCFENPIKLPKDITKSKGKICLKGGCETQPLDSEKVILYIRNNVEGVTNDNILQIIYLVSESEQFYNNAIQSYFTSFIFVKKNSGSPFGLYGYSGETVAHEITHIFGANDKYIEGSYAPCCKADPITGKEYLGEDIMCHRKIDSDGICTGIELDELKISEETAREIGWIPIV